MILKSLSLKNVRSYKDETVFFKEGITLLSGDIGSGKSTILMSVEFALFGLNKGQGHGLLRQGCVDGEVSLNFFIDKNEYVVRRTLKKTSQGIVQGSGSLSVNGAVIELTPVELKFRILELLGYPLDLISKSRPLIYRYTVYTPQEDMKAIIFDSKDERLERLRKIFGIDRYELIKNNISEYAKELRSELRQVKFLEDELSKKKKTLDDLKEKIFLKEESLKILDVELKDLKEKEKDLKEKIFLLESELKDILLSGRKLGVVEGGLKEIDRNISIQEKEYVLLDKELSSFIFPEFKDFSIEKDEHKKSLEDAHLLLEKIDFKINGLNERLAVNKNKKQSSESLIKKIMDLDDCPTCKQKVSSVHKKGINDVEEQKMSVLNEEIKSFETVLNTLFDKKVLCKQKIKRLEDEQNSLVKKIQEQDLLKQKISLFEEKKKKFSSLKSSLEDLKNKKIDLEKEMVNLKNIKESGENKESSLKNLKVEFDSFLSKLRNKELEFASVKSSLKENKETVSLLKEDYEKKKSELDLLHEKRIIENWLSNFLLNITGVIEKRLFYKLHKEFSYFFKDRFDSLIEDESLVVDVDEYFSPVIVQNGYDSDIDNLSGGEKTSVALAYRLALNKVISDSVNHIKTKDLLILDEPTDGFSMHQVDKLRDVLENTGFCQIIIVSHEQKLESFAQHLIKITKQDSVSKLQVI